jgi:hypothetical protein
MRKEAAISVLPRLLHNHGSQVVRPVAIDEEQLRIHAGARRCPFHHHGDSLPAGANAMLLKVERIGDRIAVRCAKRCDGEETGMREGSGEATALVP